MSDVTVVITSCGRLDLLRTTIRSFERYNTYKADNYFINDDSGNEKLFDQILTFVPHKYTVFYPSKKLGLSGSLDYLLSHVKTKYVFHIEDDWIFYWNKGFIEKSIKILEARTDIHQVWIRDHSDHKHPLGEVTDIAGIKVREVTHGYLQHWNGFSFNPSLRRMSDYHRMFPNGFSEFKEEIECAKHVQQFNYKAVALEESVVKHIGWGRHTENFQH